MSTVRTPLAEQIEAAGAVALGAIWSGPFWALSRARTGKGVHLQGRRSTGTLTIERDHPLAGSSPLLRAGARTDCDVRLSRMIGLPERLGDVYGIALRFPDVDGEGLHQDVLLNSSRAQAPLHRLFLPSSGWAAHPYSTCLTFDAGGGPAVLGLRARPGVRVGRSFAAVEETLAGDGLELAVTVTRPLGGTSEIGVLQLRGSGPDDGLSFDPIEHHHGGLRPTGALNRARTIVYRSSRAGRDAPTSAVAS